MIKFVLLFASMVAAQVYENPTLHGRYTPPAGWVTDKPVLYGDFGAVFTTTRVGLKPVTITMWKSISNYDAISSSRESCFLTLSRAFKAVGGSTKAPIATEVIDTTYSSGLTFNAIHVRHVDANLDWVRMTVVSGIYSQELSFSTTVSDFETNSELYYALWPAVVFYTPSTSAKVSAYSAQVEERKSNIDVLGRIRKTKGKSVLKQTNFQGAMIFRQ